MTWVSATTWTETGLLGLAFVLSAVIGLERHRRFKSAGLRTHTLVGVGSAVFGFLGAGVIFVRRGSVSGLTTAASIWLTAAVGMACGAGMPALAVMATACHLLTVTVLARFGRRMQADPVSTTLLMRYTAGQGTLPVALGLAAERGVTATVLDAKTLRQDGAETTVRATVQLEASPHLVSDLVEEITDLASVQSLRVLSDEGRPD
jgi:putative Mg2+ transporter-C (MgtC) family protein